MDKTDMNFFIVEIYINTVRCSMGKTLTFQVKIKLKSKLFMLVKQQQNSYIFVSVIRMENSLSFILLLEAYQTLPAQETLLVGCQDVLVCKK